MTTYIGHVGAMDPTVCLTTLDVTEADRAVHGGGPGTLAPARVRVNGPGPREWAMSDAGDPGDLAVLSALAREQSIRGGVYRMVPCDAVRHNLYTPDQTGEYSGWSGLAQVTSRAQAGITTEAVYVPRVAKINRLTWATSPRVPVVIEGVVYGAIHCTADPIVRVIVRDRAGAQTRAVDLRERGVDRGLRRSQFVGVSVDPTTDATVELAVQPQGIAGSWVAWPSLAYAETPYVAGRAAERVHISPPSRSVEWAWGDGHETATWTVREVDV